MGNRAEILPAFNQTGGTDLTVLFYTGINLYEKREEMMEKTITFFVSRFTPMKLEETITVSRTMKRLTVTSETDWKGYIVIRDEKNRIRLLRMRGYGDEDIVIAGHASHTSPGGVPGPVGAGRWKICLYLLPEFYETIPEGETIPLRIHMTGEKRKLQETMGSKVWVDRHYREQLWLGYYNSKEFYNSQDGWYLAALHTRTRMSGGECTIREAVKGAKKEGIDVYVPTEKNVVATGWKDSSLMTVPGVEISAGGTEFGLIGIDKMPERLEEILETSDTEESRQYLYETVREAVKRGWILNLEHPFRDGDEWDQNVIPVSALTCLDLGESQEEFRKTSAFLDQMWEQGRRIWAVREKGTLVHCEALTPEVFLDNLRKGHIIWAGNRKSELKIRSDGQKYLPGDGLMDQDRKIKIRLYIESAGKPEAVVVHNGKRIQMDIVQTQSGWKGEKEIRFYKGTWNWARVEALHPQKGLLFYSSPVWQGERVPSDERPGIKTPE